MVRRKERLVPDLIDEVDEERGAGVEAEYLDVGVGGEHRRVEADDVSRGGDEDAHLPSAICYYVMLIVLVRKVIQASLMGFTL